MCNISKNLFYYKVEYFAIRAEEVSPTIIAVCPVKGTSFLATNQRPTTEMFIDAITYRSGNVVKEITDIKEFSNGADYLEAQGVGKEIESELNEILK